MPSLLYSLTLFLSAALFFCVQPMTARFALPLLGGSSAVWITTLVYFQALLLLSALYVHITARLTPRNQSLLHLLLLSAGLLFLPFSPPSTLAPQTFELPAIWLLSYLTIGFGLPSFALAASSPMLQRWFSSLHLPDAADPYHLYAASNLGSLGVLIAYPFLIEPRLGLRGQTHLWQISYLILLAGFAICAAMLWQSPHPPSQTSQKSAPTTAAIAHTPSRPLRWIIWAALPSALLIATTTFITTDLVAAPLLSLPPLALYLFSFVITFAPKKPIPNRAWWALLPPLLLILFATLTIPALKPPFVVELALHLTTLFVASLAIHGRLADHRPHPELLTKFYIWIALGGLLGGGLASTLLPTILPGPFEHPVLLGLAATLAPPGLYRRLKLHWTLPITAIIATAIYAWPQKEVLITKRSFFGTHRVEQVPHTNIHLLYHGSTLHSAQSLEAHHRAIPLAYYHPMSPIADVFDLINRRPSQHPVAVVGLGAGSLATYAQSQRGMEFFELDPTVEAIARDPELFTFLTDCGTTCKVTIGDGRLLLQQAPPQRYELIVLDAYSSSTIPTHLLTKEALQIFLDRLQPDGILAFHISNRSMDLAPPLARLAAELHLVGRFAFDEVHEDHPYFQLYANSSQWLILARSARALRELTLDPRWEHLPSLDQAPLWTDDYVHLLSTLR